MGLWRSTLGRCARARRVGAVAGVVGIESGVVLINPGSLNFIAMNAVLLSTFVFRSCSCFSHPAIVSFSASTLFPRGAKSYKRKGSSLEFNHEKPLESSCAEICNPIVAASAARWTSAKSKWWADDHQSK